MERKELEVLVQKFLRGTISEEERSRLFAWYALAGENAEPEVLREITSKQMLERKLFSRIQASTGIAHLEKAATTAGEEAPVIPLTGHSSPYRGLWKVAASILLIISLGLLGGYWFRSQNASQLANYAQVEVQAGKKKTIELEDGSRIHLNERSKLRYPRNFSGKSRREVFLTGEAYFEVAKDASKPFVIATSNAIIQVVGTEFNVKEVAFDTSVVIAVAEGKVAVRKSAAPMEEAMPVTAGQVATVFQHQDIDTSRIDIRNYLGWLNGRLVYDQTPLSEVARQLEQIFGLRIRLADPGLAKKQLTATIRYTSLEEVLNLLAATWGISYVKYQGEVVLGTPADKKQLNP